MAGTSDKVFLRAFRWFSTAVNRLESELPGGPPFDLSGELTTILRTRLGLELDKTEATIDPSGFSATRAEAQSLAIATMITGETLAALRVLGEVLSDLAPGNIGLDDLSKIIQQIDRILDANPGKPPSAYSIAKLLLILSGDAAEPDTAPPARNLIRLLTGNPGMSRRCSSASPSWPWGRSSIAPSTRPACRPRRRSFRSPPCRRRRSSPARWPGRAARASTSASA